MNTPRSQGPRMTRIIGGAAGGRRLVTPRGVATRPTSDRVREALFSAIEAWCGSLDGLRFLDLYAGSGAVGLEAWSRGAGVVTFVEQDRKTAALIGRNAEMLGVHRSNVTATSVAAALRKTPSAPYDIAFLDPPYPLSDDEVTAALASLVAGDWLVPGGLIVVERSVRGPDLRLAGRSRGGAVEEVRRDDALVRSRRPTPRRLHPRSGVTQMPERTPGRMHRAVCPGSFDPVTNGHLDIIERAAKLFDEVVVAVGVNQSKSRLFSPEERIDMLTTACAGWDNVRVDGFTGLLTDFCLKHEIDAIVKGLRAVSDFDYELQMAQMNSSLAPVETVFVPTSPEWSFLASSLVKEVATFGGDVAGLVPEFVRELLVKRLAEREGDHEAARWGSVSLRRTPPFCPFTRQTATIPWFCSVFGPE